MEWDDVRVILALLRAKNLHDAGERLGLDSSTVSRRLSGVEDKLGARLFVRTREGLRPTAIAERLRRHAEAMEMDAASLIHAIRSEEKSASGVVRVATTDALSRVLVSEGLLDVRDEHPDLVIELLAGNIPVDLQRDDAEIAVRFAALKQPAIRARCIAKMGVGLFAAPAYLHARGLVRTAAALQGHDILLPTGELARLPEVRWLNRRPGTRVVFRSNSMPALVAAATDARGLVPLPLGWGDSEPALVRAMVLDAIPVRKVWLATPEAAMSRPAVRVVLNQIAAILGRIFQN